MGRRTAPESLWPPLDEVTARAHAGELRELGTEHGITNLRFASAGRLVGTAGDDETYDGIGFEVAAQGLLHADVMLIADRVLARPGASQDLVAASPL